MRTSHVGRFRKKPWAGLAGQKKQKWMVGLIAASKAQDRPKAQDSHNLPS
jgi:hypothetical protein